MGSIKIEKVVEEEQIDYVRYSYAINDYCLHKHANRQITLYDENDIVVHFHNKVIQGEEFEKWGADDTYIDDIVKKEMELL